MRTAAIVRKTNETSVEIRLNLDGEGTGEINTGIGFFDHMLTLFAKHSGIDLYVNAKGDLDVDGHHTIEDTGIALGRCLKDAFGDKAGIRRYGSALIPQLSRIPRRFYCGNGRDLSLGNGGGILPRRGVSRRIESPHQPALRKEQSPHGRGNV